MRGKSLRGQSLRYRTSDRFELVLHDRLRPEELRRFEPLTSDPNHWGVLRPLGSGNYRAIDRDTALLLFTLQEPGPLPEYLLDEDPRGVEASIRAMVLDGILEAETKDGEPFRFDDGGEALDLDRDVDPRSLAALRYGAALDARDARDLTIRLYQFGGEPLRRSVCDRLSTRRAVLEFLGLECGGATRRGLPAGWTMDDRPEKDWIFFRRSAASDSVASDSVASGSRGQCKLYVGCRLDDVPRVLQSVVAGLAGSEARSIKVGSSAIDLVRADKIVVYFDSFEALQKYASDLSQRLCDLDLTETGSGVAVPFTAPAGADDMLSWGVDPPKEAIPLEGTFSESWRAWVASRLAAALVATRDQGLDGDGRLRSVLERVRLDGIDTSRWTPDAALWSDP